MVTDSLRRRPLTVISDRTSLRSDLEELWKYRELLYFLAWRDVKVRYKQTALGMSWALLQPLLTMIIFALIFGRFAGVPSDGLPYPLFAYIGLVPWLFVSNTLGAGTSSLVTNANLITKVYFPRLLIPAAVVAAGILDLILGLVFLIPLLGYYRIRPAWTALLAAPLLVLLVVLVSGVVTWGAVLNVRYRDVRYAVPFLVQVWMFLTPIIYPSSMLPPAGQQILRLNPLAGIIEGLRAAIGGRELDWVSVAFSGAIALAILASSTVGFRNLERRLADLV